MTVLKLIHRILLCMFAVAALAQCGGKKSKSAGANIKVFPETPIVITADIEQPEKTAPWFDFDVEIENKTGQAFEIVALKAEITAADSSGSNSTQEIAWSPSEANYTTLTISCQYTTFGTWSVDEKKKLHLTDEGGIGCIETTVRFTADGNTKGPAGASTYRYKVKLQPLGYFIDSNGDPDDRFEKTKLFFTR